MSCSHTCHTPACICGCMCLFMHEYSSIKIFQESRNHLKIPGARRMTWSKFHSEDPQTLGTTIQNLVTTVTWHPAIVHPCMTVWYFIYCTYNQQITVLLCMAVNPLCCASSFLHRTVLLLSSTPMYLSIIECCVSQTCYAVKNFWFFEELYGSLDQQNTNIKNLNSVEKIMLTWT
jgi:hypothetical protein